MSLPERARNSYEVATFIVENGRIPDIPGGRPRYVILRPVREAGSQVPVDMILEMIATQLTSAVQRAVAQYAPFVRHPRSRQWINENIQGTLQMRNIEDTSTSASIVHMLVGQIDTDAIEDMLENARQSGSNPELELFEVEWMFNIHANTLTAGRASKWKNTLNLGGLRPYEWKFDIEMPCGIIAFVQGLLDFHEDYQWVKKKAETLKTKKYHELMYKWCVTIKENEVGNYDEYGKI